jgi:dienelactone hydrolase
MLSIKSEGEDVAQSLAERGVTAFVLKYRLNETPADPTIFLQQLEQLFASSGHARARRAIQASVGAVQAMSDGMAGVRLVRQRAKEFGLDANRVGILGFSAGALVAMNTATKYDAASRPDFVGSIYGELPEHDEVPDDAPPLFLAVAADDPAFAEASAPIYSAWRQGHHSAEMHVFHKGGHGFGMKRQGTSSDHWLDEFSWWMQSQGLFNRSAEH